MIKDFLLVRHAPAVARKAVQDYLQFSHAPLAMTHPILVQETRRYTMNQAKDEEDFVGLFGPLPAFATVVEHQFGEGIARLHDDEDYIARIRPDEMHMIDALMDGPPQFLPIDEERPVFTSDKLAEARIFDFVRRPKGMSREEFVARLLDDAEWAVSDVPYRNAIARRVDSMVGDGGGAADFGDKLEPFDAVLETWITSREAFEGIIDERRKRTEKFCDPDRSFSVVTEEHWLRGAADAFGPRASS